MYLLIDNYDSFTYNLWHYVRETGPEVEVRRNDAITAEEALAMEPEGIIISPGPCDPDRAGICLDLVEKAAGKVKMLGVCLGHQSIGQAFGGKIVRAPACMHGKTSKIEHDSTGLFANLTDLVERRMGSTRFHLQYGNGYFDHSLTATRYHSLTIEPESLPDCLEVNARSDDGVIMGVRHKELPIHGVQFHPESIASECGHALIENFLKM